MLGVNQSALTPTLTGSPTTVPLRTQGQLGDVGDADPSTASVDGNQLHLDAPSSGNRRRATRRGLPHSPVPKGS